MKIITVYEADDGTRFDSMSEVVDYERNIESAIKIVELIEKDNGRHIGDCPDEIAEFIIKYIEEINTIMRGE